MRQHLILTYLFSSMSLSNMAHSLPSITSIVYWTDCEPELHDTGLWILRQEMLWHECPHHIYQEAELRRNERIRLDSRWTCPEDENNRVARMDECASMSIGPPIMLAWLPHQNTCLYPYQNWILLLNLPRDSNHSHSSSSSNAQPVEPRKVAIHGEWYPYPSIHTRPPNVYRVY